MSAERKALLAIAATMLLASLLFVVAPPRIERALPQDAGALAGRVARHPASWQAASALAGSALDLRKGNPVALWRAAYAHATALAPGRPEPANAFARAAFFHWTELSAADRRAALEAFGPELRDETVFPRMARRIFELTGSLDLLRRFHPQSATALLDINDMALRNGFFDDYRAVRGELRRMWETELAARRGSATPEELIALLPPPPYDASEQAMLASVLEELHRRPLDNDPKRPEAIDALVGYAMRHDLPLDGIEAITRINGSASIPTRYALAQQLGAASRAAQLAVQLPPRDGAAAGEWSGLCQNDICRNASRTIDAAHGIAVTLETVQTDDVPAYAELYVDDALRGEGAVGRRREFMLPAGNGGMHRLEVRLANPATRNGFARRIRVAAVTAL